MAKNQTPDVNEYNTIPDSSEAEELNHLYVELTATPDDSQAEFVKLGQYAELDQYAKLDQYAELDTYAGLNQYNRDKSEIVKFPFKSDAQTSCFIYCKKAKFYIAVFLAVAAILILSICVGVLGYYIRKCEGNGSEFDNERFERHPTPIDGSYTTTTANIASNIDTTVVTTYREEEVPETSECKPLEDTIGIISAGITSAVGGALLLYCSSGFIPSHGSSFAVTSYCGTDGAWRPTLVCIPATCKRLADVGIRQSAFFFSYDISSQSNIALFCDFNDNIGIGYTYISKQSLSHVTDIANHYTVYDHVMIRHSRSNEENQYESKIAMLSLYRNQYNISIFIDEHPNFNLQTPYGNNGPYMYLGLVPRSYGKHRGTQQGYSCFNQDFTYENCDDNKNNYFSIFANALNGSYKKSIMNTPGITTIWKDCSQLVTPARILQEDYLFNMYDIRMGGCGVHVQSNVENIKGMAFGLPFEY